MIVAVDVTAMWQQSMMGAERATTSEVRRWLDEATQQGRTDMADRVGAVAAALQRLSDEVQEERAQAAEVAGDYTPHQLQVPPLYTPLGCGAPPHACICARAACTLGPPPSQHHYLPCTTLWDLGWGRPEMTHILISGLCSLLGSSAGTC